MRFLNMIIGLRNLGLLRIKKMSKLNIGDRVAVYGDGDRLVGQVTEVGGMRISVLFDGDSSPVEYFPQQCRKLIPRKPRREVWVNVYPDWKSANETEEAARDAATEDVLEVAVRFIEAPKKANGK